MSYENNSHSRRSRMIILPVCVGINKIGTVRLKEPFEDKSDLTVGIGPRNPVAIVVDANDIPNQCFAENRNGQLGLIRAQDPTACVARRIVGIAGSTAFIFRVSPAGKISNGIVRHALIEDQGSIDVIQVYFRRRNEITPPFICFTGKNICPGECPAQVFFGAGDQKEQEEDRAKQDQSFE